MTPFLECIYKEVEAGNVFEVREGALSLFDYTQECMFKGRWNDVNKRCRGIVVNNIIETIVARPFDKFFNLGEREETAVSIITKRFNDGEKVFPTRKIDGTMISYWWYKGDWHASTTGSLSSKHAAEAEKLLTAEMRDRMHPQYTYVCEYIAPWDAKVVDYGEEVSLTLLAVIHNQWEFKEVDSSIIPHIANFVGFKTPPFEPVIDVLTYVIPEGQEGYVLRFDDGLRVKVKSPEYSMLSNTVNGIREGNNISGSRMMELSEWYKNRDPGVFRLNKSIRSRLDDISGMVSATIQISEGYINKYWQLVPKEVSIKERALKIQEFPEIYHPVLFARMRGKDETKQFRVLVEHQLESLRRHI